MSRKSRHTELILEDGSNRCSQECQDILGRYYQCKRKVVCEVDGKFYCEIHSKVWYNGEEIYKQEYLNINLLEKS